MPMNEPKHATDYHHIRYTHSVVYVPMDVMRDTDDIE